MAACASATYEETEVVANLFPGKKVARLMPVMGTTIKDSEGTRTIFSDERKNATERGREVVRGAVPKWHANFKIEKCVASKGLTNAVFGCVATKGVTACFLYVWQEKDLQEFCVWAKKRRDAGRLGNGSW